MCHVYSEVSIKFSALVFVPYVFKTPSIHKTKNLLLVLTQVYNLDSYPNCRTQIEGYVARNR